MYKILSIALLLIGLAGISADGQTRRGKSTAKRPAVKPSAVALSSGAFKTATGLTYLITQKGTGTVLPKTGQTVVVHYTGMLTNGVKFDSSRDRDQPISFPIGTGRVIKGWDEGIGKLHVGDQAILVIPADLGYGKNGAGGGLIPADSTLIFVVELVEIKDQ
jgi:peptidylprolyl isomerase